MATFERVALIVVAAGRGQRFGGLKQLALLGGEPLLRCALRAFERLPFAQRVVVLPAEMLSDAEALAALNGDGPGWRAIEGGAFRAESVRRGLEATSNEIEFVVVHDGARPFPPIDSLCECLDRLEGDASLAGAIVAAPATDTLKRVAADHTVAETLPRSMIVRAETPQTARRARLIEALSTADAERATDEAQALEWLGGRVAVVLHTGSNLKVTTPADMDVAEAILRARTHDAAPAKEES